MYQDKQEVIITETEQSIQSIVDSSHIKNTLNWVKYLNDDFEKNLHNIAGLYLVLFSKIHSCTIRQDRISDIKNFVFLLRSTVLNDQMEQLRLKKEMEKFGI